MTMGKIGGVLDFFLVRTLFKQLPGSLQILLGTAQLS
jgi:hypothetical protein